MTMVSPTRSIHNTEPHHMDDVIIIGGSFAGLVGDLATPGMPSVTTASWQGAMAGIFAQQSMLV